jgi:hypothetical protein
MNVTDQLKTHVVADTEADGFASLSKAQQDELVSEVRGIAREFESQIEDAARDAEREAADCIEELYQTYGPDAVHFAVHKYGRANNYTHQCESLGEIALYVMN